MNVLKPGLVFSFDEEVDAPIFVVLHRRTDRLWRCLVIHVGASGFKPATQVDVRHFAIVSYCKAVHGA